MKIPLFLAAFLFCAKCFAFSFVDDLGRKIEVPEKVKAAGLQGSLVSLWLLSGGELACATSDAFLEPPALSKKKAESENQKWKTDAFFEHDSGVFALLKKPQKKTEKIGTMASPNAEKIIVSGANFAILSAKQDSHKKIGRILEKSGIKCAFFNYDGFDSFVRIFEIFCKITNRADLFEKYGANQKNAIDEICARKSWSGKKVLVLRASANSVMAKDSDSTQAGNALKKMGARNIADSNAKFRENLSVEKMIQEEPDFIFAVTMGQNEEKSLDGLKKLIESDAAFRNLKAVRENRFFVLPRELFHFKPNDRWQESFLILERILQN